MNTLLKVYTCLGKPLGDTLRNTDVGKFRHEKVWCSNQNARNKVNAANTYAVSVLSYCPIISVLSTRQGMSFRSLTDLAKGSWQIIELLLTVLLTQIMRIYPDLPLRVKRLCPVGDAEIYSVGEPSYPP